MRPFSLVAPLVGADGYGQAAEQLTLAARRLGADVEFAHFGDWHDPRFSDPKLVRSEVQTPTREVVVLHFLPFIVSRFSAPVRLLSTMFETDSAPPFWMAFCNATNGLLVPSEHCRRAFTAAGATVPIKVTPYGVDTSFYHGLSRSRHKPVFTFLMAGLLHYRKGADIAVRAFREEFTAGEAVRLTLKTRRGFLDLGDEDLPANLKIIDQDYSREQMRALYYASDCFLAPSRGEASGLTPREAMATGLPVIATNWGGLSEICDERCMYPLDIEGLAPAPPTCSSYDANVAGTAPIGNFAVPSVEHLREQMRRVYTERKVAELRGREAIRWMRSDWTWEKCARVWLEAIEALS